MLTEFLTFVNDHFPDLSSHKSLLTISGGVDSVVMADLFQKASFPFSIAHCNFGLRGDESDGDELFVRQWATKHGITAYFRKFQIQETADRQGISIQMAARDERFAWFEQLRQRERFHYIATAHHLNDSIETTLLNLTRGTGVAGLPGIIPRQGYLIRPLLFATKQQILNYALEQHIPWREDSSNLTDHYRRNLLRHQVIPVLQKINPSLENTFRTTSERLHSANTILNSYLTRWKNEVMRQEKSAYYVSISMIQSAEEPVFQLHFLLESFGFNYAQSRQIVASLDGISGKIFRSSKYELIKDRTELILSPLNRSKFDEYIIVFEDTDMVLLPGLNQLLIQRKPASQTVFPTTDPTIAYFDETLVRFPLTIRPWRKGDWLCPFGMNGKRKKVSDLLVDQKVPLNQKKNSLVLLDKDQQILWVLGIRADDRVRINSDTKDVLCVSIIN